MFLALKEAFKPTFGRFGHDPPVYFMTDDDMTRSQHQIFVYLQELLTQQHTLKRLTPSIRV
jgi:hypothetical protein